MINANHGLEKIIFKDFYRKEHKDSAKYAIVNFILLIVCVLCDFLCELCGKVKNQVIRLVKWKIHGYSGCFVAKCKVFCLLSSLLQSNYQFLIVNC